METNLTEEQRRLLTEWMGECYHGTMIGSQYDGYAFTQCLECYERHEKSTEFNRRTFTTWQDLGDLKEKLVEKGLCDEFDDFTVHFYCEASGGMLFWVWIMNPPLFCWLVANFLEKELPYVEQAPDQAEYVREEN